MSGDSIKIIHFGKFLDDAEKTLEEYKVAENARIIIYVNKKPVAQHSSDAQQKTVAQQGTNPSTSNSSVSQGPVVPPASVGQPQQAPASSSSPTINRPIVPPLPPSSTSLSNPTAGGPATSAPTNPSPVAPAPSLPPVDTEKLQQMLLMGFDEDKSRKALISANGNVELAVDYVLSGNIPEPAPRPAQPNPGFGASGPGQTELQQLMLYLQQNDPETYAQVRANPALLNQLLEQARMYLSNPRPPSSVVPPGGTTGGAPAAPSNPGAVGALATVLTPDETEKVRQISELTGLDMDRCKVVFVRLGRNPDVACDVIFESSDRLRALSPMEIDYMFISMQQRAAAASAANNHGDVGYDSDDGSSMSEGGSDDGDDDDFYL